MRLASLFSKEQRAFYNERAPHGVALDSLQTFGPTFVLKVRLWLKPLERRLVVEMWLFPDGTRNLEISTKCEPRDTFQVTADLKAYLKGVGIELTGDQQTKTRAAMEFFKPDVRQKAKARKARAPCLSERRRQRAAFGRTLLAPVIA